MMNEHEVQPLRPETLRVFGNDGFRARIFHEKYALRGADGTVLEHLPAQMWQRVSQGIAAVEAPEQQREWEEKFVWLLSDFRMVPAGRILHAIDNPNDVTALNCYVVPAPHDSLKGIYHTANHSTPHTDRSNLSGTAHFGAFLQNAHLTLADDRGRLLVLDLLTGKLVRDLRIH